MIIMRNKGVSPFIASVLTILFGVIMLGIVLNVINPVFSRAQDSSVVSDSFQNLNLLNSVIKDVASESQGSKRTISFSVSGGEYSTDVNENLLVFTYEPSEPMNMRGSRGDINLEQGLVFDDYFNHYADGSMPSGVWTNTSGEWYASSYKYRGDGGLAYHNLSTVQSIWFSGDIYNSSGTGGQIFVTPTNPERLVAFWGFDEGSGAKAYDLTGNMNNGSLGFSPTWTSGIVGGGILFTEGTYIDVPDSASLNFLNTTGEITVSAWIYPTNYTGKTSSQWYILSKLDYSDSGWWFYLINGGTVRFTSCYSHACAGITTDYSVPLNEWSHVVALSDGNVAKIFVNGVEKKSGSIETLIDASNKLTISTGPGYSFNGIIDEPKVWSKALTADEVLAEYYLSQSKLMESGSASAGVKIPNGAIVLTNPDGVTSFDNIKISDGTKTQSFVVPYTNIDLNGTLRIPAGEYRITVEHMGINTTVNKPIIQVTSR